jgi:hypothetical protein
MAESNAIWAFDAPVSNARFVAVEEAAAALVKLAVVIAQEDAKAQGSGTVAQGREPGVGEAYFSRVAGRLQIADEDCLKEILSEVASEAASDAVRTHRIRAVNAVREELNS